MSHYGNSTVGPVLNTVRGRAENVPAPAAWTTRSRSLHTDPGSRGGRRRGSEAAGHCPDLSGKPVTLRVRGTLGRVPTKLLSSSRPLEAGTWRS